MLWCVCVCVSSLSQNSFSFPPRCHVNIRDRGSQTDQEKGMFFFSFLFKEATSLARATSILPGKPALFFLFFLFFAFQASPRGK